MAYIDVDKVMREEVALACERATARVMPVIRKEFQRLCKRYPKLKGILFGNGTHYIDYGDETHTFGLDLPKEFAKLNEMCSFASSTQYTMIAFECDLKRPE